MNAKEFFDLVCEMRKNQKAYFKTRDAVALSESKRLERQVDAEIERVNNILNDKQQKLFDI